MPRIPVFSAATTSAPTTSAPVAPRVTSATWRSGGRPHAMGTVVANEMVRRGFRVHEISTVLRCSDRQFYNYQRRLNVLSLRQVADLADFLDMEPEELVDGERKLIAQDPIK